jgi:ribosomal protein S18 acetylase RimI-like enzyme
VRSDHNDSLCAKLRRIIAAEVSPLEIRSFHPGDAAALASLATACSRGESDFVLNPLWHTEAELFAEFDRFGISPQEHLLVAHDDDGVVGLAGFLRQPGANSAALFCPIVSRGSRGRGVGGELLRAAQQLGTEVLGIDVAFAGIGTRNRGGYSLLASHGFRPVRQHFWMRCDGKVNAAQSSLEGFEISPAQADDADAILEIYTSCGFDARDANAMRAVLEDGRHAHAVSRLDGRVVAFAEIETHWQQRVWVAFVGVIPELRDRGLGSTLVAWALERQFESGAQSAMLMLSPANRTALRAYEKVGFRRARLVDVLEKRFKAD